jgi:tetratricopeptide (TPR) repeat protein
MSKLLIHTFLLLTLFANAQNKAIDSMLVVLKKSNKDIANTKTLNAIADAYKTSDPKMMLVYANKALQLSKKIGYKLEEGNAYLNLGNANLYFGNYSIALDNFTKSQIVFENELNISTPNSKIDLQNNLARSYGSIGKVFTEQSNYAKALQYNFKALKLFEATKNDEKLARVYNNIGVIYKSQDELFKASIYFEKCLKIQEKTPNDLLGTYTSNIGLVYFNQKNYPKALEYFNKAKLYFDKYPNTQSLAQLYYNYGLYYKEISQNEKAISYTNKALELFSKVSYKFGIADAYANLGAIYFEQKKYEEAFMCINKGLMIAKELHVLDKVQAFEKDLSEIYEKQNNISEALKHYKLYSNAKDSIVNRETVENSLRTELNYEFDRKEMLQKQAQIKRDIVFAEQSKSNKWKIVFSVLLALLASGIAFLIYNRTQLRQKLTLEKELAIYEQKALHLQMNPHFIFNCLGSISSFIVQNSTDAAIKYLAKFSKLMRLTLEYSKETLIPIDKEIESLQNYLELEQLRFNNTFEFKINKCKEIEDDVALPPLLLQPFVENAIIHGMNPKLKNGTIAVDFVIKDESLVCTIIDNGVGINKSKALKASLVSMHKSMALDITQKRLQMMETTTSKQSRVTIEEINKKGEVLGTKVVMHLPLVYLK